MSSDQVDSAHNRSWLGFKQLWQGCVKARQFTFTLTKPGFTSQYLLARLARDYLVLSGSPPFASLTIGLIDQTLSSKASLKLYCAVSPAPKAPVSKRLRCDYVFCYPLRTDMMLLHGYILLSREKLSAWCRAGLHMTANTLGASQVRAIQHADGKYQTRHDKFMRELTQVCVSSEWLKCYMGRLWLRRFYRQQWYYRCSYRKPVIHSNNTRTQIEATGTWVSSTWGSSAMQTSPRSQGLFKVSLLDVWLLTTVQRYTAQSFDILTCVGLPPDNTRWRPAMRQLTCQEA